MFNLSKVHASWKPVIEQGLRLMDSLYLQSLTTAADWLPGADNIFSAFSLPIDQVNVVLFGESPYPRQQSANGYAFWDAAVNQLWSSNGMSKQVNRATSLRNFLKMLMVAEGLLTAECTDQNAIANINKQNMIQTNEQLFTRLLQHGFLLLNITPVLHSQRKPQQEARAWAPFIHHVLTHLQQQRPKVKYLFLGKIAKDAQLSSIGMQDQKIYAEHPYNISFIHNPSILHFFKPLHLLNNCKSDKVI